MFMTSRRGMRCTFMRRCIFLMDQSSELPVVTKETIPGAVLLQCCNSRKHTIEYQYLRPVLRYLARWCLSPHRPPPNHCIHSSANNETTVILLLLTVQTFPFNFSLIPPFSSHFTQPNELSTNDNHPLIYCH